MSDESSGGLFGGIASGLTKGKAAKKKKEKKETPKIDTQAVSPYRPRRVESRPRRVTKDRD